MMIYSFIDEIHTIVGAGGATGSLDASICLNLLWREIQCIGATTREVQTIYKKRRCIRKTFPKDNCRTNIS
jgi:ATP-dependent Clp protease ATP-binding subunit ClpA